MAGHSKWVKVKTKGIKAASAAITFLPTVTVCVADATAAGVQKLAELLEDHDDVKEVYSNAEFPHG
mgnify:CR=1 FL=1